MVSVESRSTWAFDFAIDDSPAQSSKEAYGVSLGMIGATDGRLGSCELRLRYAPPAWSWSVYVVYTGAWSPINFYTKFYYVNGAKT